MIYLVHLLKHTSVRNTISADLQEKWVDNVVVNHLKVLVAQPVLYVSLSPSKVVVHNKHLSTKTSTCYRGS